MFNSKHKKYDQKSNSISIRSINILTPPGATGPSGTANGTISYTTPSAFGVSGGSSNQASGYGISGSGGAGGAYTTSSITTSTGIYGASSRTVFDSDVIIRREGQPDIAIGQTLDSIAKRLAILEPDFDKMSKFPALKEAYDNYKMIEALVTGMDDDEQSS